MPDIRFICPICGDKYAGGFDLLDKKCWTTYCNGVLFPVVSESIEGIRKEETEIENHNMFMYRQQRS